MIKAKVKITNKEKYFHLHPVELDGWFDVKNNVFHGEVTSGDVGFPGEHTADQYEEKFGFRIVPDLPNGKEELRKILHDPVIRGKARIKCASLTRESFEKTQTIVLKVGYTKEELSDFVRGLDFEYDNKREGERLKGTIWLTDGSWLIRVFHGSLQHWEHRTVPEIPTELL